MIKQRYEIKADIKTVWKCLTDEELVKRWSGAPANMSDQEGAEFSLWGGDIWGTNTKVAAPNRLEQDWYANDWQDPSKVVIMLQEIDGETIVEVDHTNLPANEQAEFEKGWQEFYFDPLATLAESI